MAEKAGKDTGVQSSTPYDDVFRTLLNDCRQLVIQLVNEVFGENYTGEEEISGDTLEVVIPNCAILFLRSTRNTPEQMHIRFQFREQYFTYDIPVIKVQRYSLDDLLRKNLLFLLPFYIFTYDRKLQEYNTNEEKLNALRAEYRMIVKHLNDLEYSNQLSTYYKKTLIEMSEKVVDNLTAGYENIRKGVKTVMGGKILEYEAKTILRQGEQKGRQLGRLETLVQNIKGLMKTMGWSAEQAMDMMQVSEEDRAAVSSRL